MTTLPLITPRESTARPRQNISYLRFPKSLESKPMRHSLQQQAYSAMHDHKYLYIDFQADSFHHLMQTNCSNSKGLIRLRAMRKRQSELVRVELEASRPSLRLVHQVIECISSCLRRSFTFRGKRSGKLCLKRSQMKPK